jgi:AcrR family transcriptional regulator
MPTKTFFNLPQQKRDKLMRSIRTELARAPFAEASINRIVRAAGIPRGSFYQYFEGKRDVLDYIMADYREALTRCAEDSLAHSGGDLFRMFMDILDFTVEYASRDENGALFWNLFSDAQVNATFLKWRTDDQSLGIMTKGVLRRVDMRALDIRCDSDFEDMAATLLSLAVEAFAQVCFDPASYRERRARYAARLALIQRGFLKDKAGERCPDASS